MKLCIDYRFVQPADEIRKSRCGDGLAKRVITSPVDGSQESFQISCRQFRLMLEGCDEDGKFWRPNSVGFE